MGNNALFLSETAEREQAVVVVLFPQCLTYDLCSGAPEINATKAGLC